MKKSWIAVCSVLLLLLISCKAQVEPHIHTFAETWTFDETNHWHETTCRHDVISRINEHTFGEYVSDRNATTEVDGTKTRVCSACKYTDTVTDEGSKIHVHTFSEDWTYDKTNHWYEPACGHDVESIKTEHTFGEYVSDGNATTEADGTKTRICSVCKYKNTVTDEGSKIHEHTFVSVWSSDRTHHWYESTCGHDVAGRKTAHTFGIYISDGNATTEADGTKTRICSVCKYKNTVTDKGSKIHGHNFEETWTYDETNHWHEPTCGHDEKEGESNHEWNHEDFQYDPVLGKEIRTCTVCLYVNEKKHVHSETSGTVTIAPTCGTTGVKTYKCTVCNAVTTTEEIVATGHTEDRGVVTTAPTCVTNGVKTYKCTVCDAVVRTEEIAATGHAEDSGIMAITPTCLKKGLESYKCTSCGVVIRTEEIDATGHTECTETIAPTCVTKGVKTYKCTDCDVVFRTEEIPELYSSPVDAESGEIATADSAYIYFGVFPKTVLPSDSTITVDEIKMKVMGANIYYRGNDGNYYAKVTIDGAMHYFKVEPIKWKVLTNDYNGKWLLVAEETLTVMRYYVNTLTRTIDGNTVYPNNYKYSTIRAYLNGVYENDDTQDKIIYEGKGFLQTAFTNNAQLLIATTAVDNSGSSTTDVTWTLQTANGSNSSYPTDYTCADTMDKIFLLSEKEVTKTAYGFGKYNAGSYARRRVGTNYADAIASFYDGTTTYCNTKDWWLRSPYYDYKGYARYVQFNGEADNRDFVDYYLGVVPALCLTLE